MDGDLQDAWFFTREGERSGPVTLSELREQAQAGKLNPRLDLVWTQGMAEWQAAGEIDGLFEKRKPPALPEALAPAADPYTPPKLDPETARNSMLADWPGARRRSFLFMTILFPFVWNFVFALGAGFLANPFGPEIMKAISLGAAVLPLLVGIYYGLQRLVNLGMNRCWYLANFVPFLNLWVGYRCFACPAGYAYHKKLDGAGVALAIIYWLIVAISILAVAAVVALWFGAMGNPELQEQVRELFRMVVEQSSKR